MIPMCRRSARCARTPGRWACRCCATARCWSSASATSPLAKEYFAANPEMASAILKNVPVGRFGDSEQDIGPIAVFLASEGSGYYTGNTMFVDGGGHINGVPWRPEVED